MTLENILVETSVEGIEEDGTISLVPQTNLTAATYRRIADAIDTDPLLAAQIALQNGDTYLAIDTLRYVNPVLAGKIATSMRKFALAFDIYRENRFYHAAAAIALAMRSPDLAFDVAMESGDRNFARDIAQIDNQQ